MVRGFPDFAARRMTQNLRVASDTYTFMSLDPSSNNIRHLLQRRGDAARTHFIESASSA